MKPVYSAIQSAHGAHKAGVCKCLIAPKAAFSSIIIKPISGTAILPTPSGYSWQTIEFAPNTFTLEEKVKQSRSGDYYEILVQGTLNQLTAPIQQALNTYANEELIIIVQDVEGRRKLIGNLQRGATIRLKHKHNRIQMVEIDIVWESAMLLPFIE